MPRVVVTILRPSLVEVWDHCWKDINSVLHIWSYASYRAVHGLRRSNASDRCAMSANSFSHYFFFAAPGPRWSVSLYHVIIINTIVPIANTMLKSPVEYYRECLDGCWVKECKADRIADPRTILNKVIVY